MVGEQEFIIKARDELTATLKQLQAAAGKFGTDTKREFEKAAAGGDAYTRWMREERTNQRQQNFLFRQLREVTGAAALGLTMLGSSADGSSPKMKRLTDGLTEGFVAFQGIEFALGQINPVLGVVAGSVAGLAVAFSKLDGLDPQQLDDISKRTAQIVDAVNKMETSKVDALRAYIDELERIGKKGQGIPEAVANTRKEFEKLDDATANSKVPDFAEALARGFQGQEGVDNLNRATAAMLASTPVMERIAKLRKELADKGLSQADIDNEVLLTFGNVLTVVDAVADSTEEVRDVTNKYKDAIKDIVIDTSKISALVDAQFPLQSKIVDAVNARLTVMNLIGEKEFIERSNIERRLAAEERIASIKRDGLSKVAETRPNIGENVDRRELFGDDVLLKTQEGFNGLGVTAENTAGLIMSSMQQAAATIVDVFFGATTSIGEFFENLARTIMQMLFEQLLKTAVTSFITDVLKIGGFGATTAPVPVGGIPAEVTGETTGGFNPAHKTININVNGKPIVTSPRDRRKVIDAVAEAIFAEKYAWS